MEIYASEGAVKQEGALRVAKCKTCGREIVFATSRRSGKKYAVNVSRGYLGQKFYRKSDAHDCAAEQDFLARMQEREAARDAKRAELRKAFDELEAMHAAGQITTEQFSALTLPLIREAMKVS